MMQLNIVHMMQLNIVHTAVCMMQLNIVHTACFCRIIKLLNNCPDNIEI